MFMGLLCYKSKARINKTLAHICEVYLNHKCFQSR